MFLQLNHHLRSQSDAAKKVVKSSVGKGLVQKQIIHNKVNRSYLLYAPSGASGKKKLPIVLNFHGFGATAVDQLHLSDWRSLSDRHGFILVYPQGLELEKGGSHWNPNPVSEGGKSTSDDLGFVKKIVKQLSKRFAVDAARIYAVGYSNGAGMAFGLAQHASELVAAIAPVSGLMNDKNLSTVSGISPVGLISFNGTADWLRPVGGIQGYLASAEDASRHWAQINDSSRVNSKWLQQDSKKIIKRTTFSRDDGTATVQQHIIYGAGHDWFDLKVGGKNINQLAWRFLSRLRKKNRSLVSVRSDSIGLHPPSQFKPDFVDKIINFRSSRDVLVIDSDGFGVDNLATFATGRNLKVVKKQLAKQDFNFLYDQSRGGLYFNENGSDDGFGDGGMIAILKGAPSLMAANLRFI